MESWIKALERNASNVSHARVYTSSAYGRHGRGQVDLGARHVQEAVRAALREGARLLDVDHVVRNGRHLGGKVGAGAESTERSDESHRVQSYGARGSAAQRRERHVPVFPGPGRAGIAEHEVHQARKRRLRPDVVRQDDDAVPAALDADPCVPRGVVVAALVEARPLWAVEDDHAEAGREIRATPGWWDFRLQRRKLRGCGDWKLRPREFGAALRRQAVASHVAGRELRDVVQRRVHRPGCAYLAALVVRHGRALRVPAVGQVGGEVGPPHHAGRPHSETVEHAPLHLGPDVESEPLFEHELEQDQAFARVGVAGPGREMKTELPVGLDEREVGKARRVRKQDPRRQLPPAVVPCKSFQGPYLSSGG